MHRVFISYHHANDQWAKEEILRWNKHINIFIDESVHMGDIDDSDLSDQEIREIIRDQYLKKSTVTILLVGTETQYRKHVDWELYSSMYDGPVNQKSGIIVIMLPSTGCTHCYASHENEKTDIFETYTDWNSVDTKVQVNQYYPYLPSRIADNLLTGQSKITIVNWKDLTPGKLKILIDNAYNDKDSCTYVFPPMRRKNFNP